MSLRKLYVELTSSCNLDCAICYRHSWADAPRDMSAECLGRVIEASRRSDDLRRIVLGGIGEPTVAPLFVEALAAFPGKEITVTTNGFRLRDEVIEGIARHADVVVFSVDGLDAAFRRVRGAELDNVIASVRSLLSLRSGLVAKRPQIEFQFVLSGDNAADLPGVIDLAADIGVGLVAVSHLLPQSVEQSGNILYDRYALGPAKDLFERVRLLAMRRGVRVLLPPLELKTERRCAFIEDETAYVTAEGDVVPCYRFSHDGEEFVLGRQKHVSKHSFGNINETALDAIWESPPYARYRKTLFENRYPSCPDCDLLAGCDMVADTSADCWSNTPTCADCLWARGFMRCP